MYNEQLKREFIDQYTDKPSRVRFCEALFNGTEQYEKLWKADICTKSGEELDRAVNHIVGARTSSQKGRLSVLREYFRWCAEKGIPGASGAILSGDVDSTEKMRSRTVSSPLHLQMYLDGIFLKESLKTRDNILRAYCWLAYMGLPEKDIMELRSDEVDLQNMIVAHGDAEYRIYAEAVPCLRNCKELTFFYYVHPRYPDKAFPRDRADGDLLIRGTTPETTVYMIRNDVAKAGRKYKTSAQKGGGTEEQRFYRQTEALRLSYYRIWLSGLFYRTFLLEGAGVPPDFSEAIAKRAAEREHRFSGKTYNERTFRNSINSEYNTDYAVWKKAFYQ